MGRLRLRLRLRPRLGLGLVISPAIQLGVDGGCGAMATTLLGGAPGFMLSARIIDRDRIQATRARYQVLNLKQFDPKI